MPAASYVVLPALALTVTHHLGSMIRIVEATVTQARHAPYVKGPGRGASGPLVAQLGSLIGATVAGAYAIKVIFSRRRAGRVGADWPRHPLATNPRALGVKPGIDTATCSAPTCWAATCGCGSSTATARRC